MHNIWIVFRKELTDTLRDRRTLLMAVVVPLLLFPLLGYGIATFAASQTEEARTQTLDVGLVRQGNAAAFAERLRSRENLNVVTDFPADSARALVRRDSLDAVFRFAADFDRRVAARAPGALTLFYESGSDMGIIRDRLLALVEDYRQELLDQRLAALDLSRQTLQTVTLNEVDVATTRESIGQIVGGYLPYISLLFCFLGGMYPAIDLGAGEKERRTMETLLTVPASRTQLALGKFSVIAVAGLVSAFVAIGGLYAAVQLISGEAEELAAIAQALLSPGVIALLLSLLVPLTMFFAGAQLVLSLYAKSFKEAQSIFSPLMIVIIIPAALALLPGVELTPVTALVPVLNVALASKAIVAGTIETGPLLLTYASLIVLAGISLAACTWYFRKESVIFRT